MSQQQLKLLRILIKEMVQASVKTEGRTKKPGGGLTDLGALRRVHPAQWKAKVANALQTQDADVDDVADQLDVSPRTVYLALEDNRHLQREKDVIDQQLSGQERLEKKAFSKGKEQKSGDDEEDEDEDQSQSD